ncbi:hypothetical protein JVU11DRAFT_12486 [Chiua virens]|nr:hypothetical protein JVU11DRAFT_12486 [Chiua virens]
MRSTRTNDPNIDRNHEAHFRTSPIHSLSLSTLKNLFLNQKHQAAINLLRSRSQLLVNHEFTLTLNSHDVVPSVRHHYIDFTLYLGARVGLDALLPSPRVLVDHTWHVNLTFSRLFKSWKESHLSLPFSTTGRMLCLGDRGQEEIWLAFVPSTLLDTPDALPDMTPLSITTTTSCLTPEHAYMAVMFFAFLLSEMHFQDVSYRLKYPHPISANAVRQSTELLGRLDENHRSFQLTLAQTRDLDRHIRAHWDAWVHDAPESWKRDGFLTQNSPVALTVRYGQNQPICHSHRPEHLQEESNAWDRDRDYSHLRLAAFSLAHHLSFREVVNWENLSGPALHRFHGDLYDLPVDDPARTLVDLNRLQDGHEIPVYTRDGYRVRRRIPTLDGYIESGALMDLTKVDALFPPDDNGRNTHHAYPLGFTKLYGNVQANRTIVSFDKGLNDINVKLTPPLLPRPANLDEEDEGDDQMDDLENEDEDEHALNLNQVRHGMPVLHGIYCQMYNAIAHRVREQARFHYVQLGLATSVLCGTKADTPSCKRRFQRRKEHCDNGLPHERYARMVRGDDQPQALRVEQTYVLDVHRLRPRHRNGRTIYEKVVSKLCKQFIHPRTLDPILACVKPFKPEVIPNLLNWTTYPLTSLIELVWNQHKRAGIRLGQAIDPYHVEFMSMLERCLNYAHTGSGKVLCKKLMLPHYMCLGIIHDGFPCLNQQVVPFMQLSMKVLHVETKFWARCPEDDRPLMGSKRVQELTYGKAYAQRSEACFIITDTIDNPPPMSLTSYYSPNVPKQDMSNMSIDIMDRVLKVAMKIYIEDVKSLVSKAVMTELAPIFINGTRQEKDTARTRKFELKTWLKSDNPLSYEDQFLNLLSAVSPARHDNNPIPFSFQIPNGGRRPLSFFVQSILDGAHKRRAPPFIQDGMFQHIMAAALDQMKEITWRQQQRRTPYVMATVGNVFMDDDDTSGNNMFRASLTRVVGKMKVNHVPWSESRTAEEERRPGRPSSRIVHTTWLPLGEAERERTQTGSNGGMVRVRLNPPQTRQTELVMSSQRIAHDDPRTSWSACRHRLSDFHKVLHKRSLPTEWNLSHVSNTPFSKSVYEWVKANYDPTSNPLHAIAMFIALIYTGLTPKVFAPTTLNTSKHWSSVELADFYAMMAWTERKNKRGAKQLEPFVTMASGFIIAVLDKHSPLCDKVGTDSDDVKMFLDKHTAKGITLTNTILRFRLAKPFGKRVAKGPRWNQNTTPATAEEIKRMWDRIKHHLMTNKEYGAYDAVVELAGEHTAMLLLENEWVRTRGHIDSNAAITMSNTLGQGNGDRHASTSKRRLDDSDGLGEGEESSDDNDLIVLPQGHTVLSMPSTNRRRIS